MGAFQRFEEIVAWQEARKLTKAIYKVTALPSFSRDFSLIDQMRRSSVSIMSNIAEGFERSGRREFIQFLALSKGSSGELRSHLYIALDLGYLTKGDFQELYNRTAYLAGRIGALMKYLRDSNIRGAKFQSLQR